MRRKLWTVFIIIYILFGMLCLYLGMHYLFKYNTSFSQNEWVFLNSIGELTMAGDSSFPPLSFRDVNGQPSGYEADLVSIIERELGIKIRLVQMTWSKAVEALKTGEIAGITGMRVTEERAKVFGFTRPFWQTTYSIVELKGNSAEIIKRNGLKVAVQEGSFTYNVFYDKYHHSGVHYIFVNDPLEGIDLLVKGEVDLWVENYLVARYYALFKGKIDNFIFHPIPGSTGNYAIAFGREYVDLIPIFNKVLLRLEKKGLLAGLDNKWFGLINNRYSYTYWPLVVLGLVFLIMTTVFIFYVRTSYIRKETRVQLKKKEEFSNAIINNLSESLVVLDSNGKVIATNRAWEKSFYPSEGRSIFCSKGIDYLQISEKLVQNEIHRQRIVYGLGEVINGKSKEFSLEYPCQMPGGERWLHMRATPMSDRHPSSIIIVHTDITDIKVTDEALSESEEKYRTTFENTGTSMLIIEEDTSVSLANKQTEILTGYSREELQGISWTKLVYQPDLEKMLTYHYSRRKSGEMVPRQYEARFQHKNGTIMHVIVTVNMFPGTTQSIASLIDITHLRTMEKSLMESKTKIEKLHEIAIKMERCQSEDEVYKLIIEAAECILNFNFCIVDSVEDDYFVTRAASSQVVNRTEQKVPVTEGLGGKTYRTGKTYLVNDLWVDKEAKAVSKDYRSAISAPIGEIGIFQVVSNESNAFNQEDVGLTEILLSHAVEAIKRIRFEEKIRYMSFHDSLTGLHNRAFFDVKLNELNKEQKFPLSIIIGDINGLKLVNDVFGHQKGDEYINLIADIIKNSVRKEDIVIRWGGDEFAILLSETDEFVATNICHKIRYLCTQVKTNLIKPSIALGVATKENKEQNIQDVLKEAEDRMYRNKLVENRSARSAIITSLERTLWEKSYESEEHVRKLQRLVSYFEKPLNLTSSQMDDLYLLASLHDIGKIAIPESIIKKPDPLSEEEWEFLKRHSDIGYRIAQSLPELGPIADAILSHHERWDGTGYPEGLEKEEIPLISRIVSIVDAFDVMTHGRPYRNKMTVPEAIQELKRCAGSQFDPNLVDIFITEYLNK